MHEHYGLPVERIPDTIASTLSWPWTSATRAVTTSDRERPRSGPTQEGNQP